jgi:hypothetical protein
VFLHQREEEGLICPRPDTEEAKFAGNLAEICSVKLLEDFVVVLAKQSNVEAQGFQAI